MTSSAYRSANASTLRKVARITLGAKLLLALATHCGVLALRAACTIGAAARHFHQGCATPDENGSQHWRNSLTARDIFNLLISPIPTPRLFLWILFHVFLIGVLYICTFGPALTRQSQPDSFTNACTSPGCACVFSMWNRRHHCRRCGGIFCGSHTSREVRLDQHARFHPQGTFNRACDGCYETYREWKRARSSRQNSVGSGSSEGTQATATPVVGVPGAREVNTSQEQKVGSVAQSVPRDWSWSTF